MRTQIRGVYLVGLKIEIPQFLTIYRLNVTRTVGYLRNRNIHIYRCIKKTNDENIFVDRE